MRGCHICTLPGGAPGRVLRPLWWPRLLLAAGAPTTLLPDHKDGAMLPRRRAVTSQARPPGFPPSHPADDDRSRSELLRRRLSHHQAVPQRRALVVWSDVGGKPREDFWGLTPCPELQTPDDQQHENRLRASLALETQALMAMTTLLSAPDLVFAFSVWQQFPDELVGFVPSKHVSTASQLRGFELQTPGVGDGDHAPPARTSSSSRGSAASALLGDTQNCNDIAMAMNFLVAKHTRKTSGVFVKPVNMGNLEKETGGHSGMWRRAEHFLPSSYCVHRLVRRHPLRYSYSLTAQFSSAFPMPTQKSGV
uniref:Glycosyl transferase 64 domain-containing protein n=1 Tax=Myotis lucifugus TaxID=59463 RepID=G1QEP8_MYOLU